jgi:hypothetical protein
MVPEHSPDFRGLVDVDVEARQRSNDDDGKTVYVTMWREERPAVGLILSPEQLGDLIVKLQKVDEQLKRSPG